MMQSCTRRRGASPGFTALLAGSISLIFAATLPAQVLSDPRIAEFDPSPDHWETQVGGEPAVLHYELGVYRLGDLAPFATVNIGKPSPEADGKIRYDFSSEVAGWTLPGGTYEARVSAVGPEGAALSEPSNPFTFAGPSSCTYSLSTPSVRVPSAGGSCTVEVSTGTGCEWAAAASLPWITVTTAGASGSGTLLFGVAANSSATSRAGTLTVGDQSLSVHQEGATAPAISWLEPAPILEGTPLTATQLSAVASVPGAFSYSPAAGTVLAAGTYALTAVFAPSDTVLYTGATASVRLTVTAVTKTTPAITWAAPAPITKGTPLGPGQLNAAADVAGTFAYSPAAGSVLHPGTHTLTTIFTPSNTLLHTTATSAVRLTVNAAPIYRLTLKPSNGGAVKGAGLNCGASGTLCQVTMPAEMYLGLEAVADAGFTFAGWTDDCMSGTGKRHTILLNGSKSCGAVFAPVSAEPAGSSGNARRTSTDGVSYTLTVTPPVGGTVLSAGITCGTRGNACAVTMPGPMTIGLMARPDAGYVFSGWSGSCSGSHENYALALQGPRTCTAAFTETAASGLAGPSPFSGSMTGGTGDESPYTLTVARPEGGTVLGAGVSCGTGGGRCSVTMPGAVWLGLLARPDDGYVFSGWVGDCAGASPGYAVRLDRPKSCGASFVASRPRKSAR